MLTNYRGEGRINQPLNMPETHVEWNDCHPDVLRGLLVNVRQLQPGMILLLPGPQCVLARERRICDYDESYIIASQAICKE